MLLHSFIDVQLLINQRRCDSFPALRMRKRTVVRGRGKFKSWGSRFTWAQFKLNRNENDVVCVKTFCQFPCGGGDAEPSEFFWLMHETKSARSLRHRALVSGHWDLQRAPLHPLRQQWRCGQLLAGVASCSQVRHDHESHEISDIQGKCCWIEPAVECKVGLGTGMRGMGRGQSGRHRCLRERALESLTLLWGSEVSN